jgi:hypothetical protein
VAALVNSSDVSAEEFTAKTRSRRKERKKKNALRATSSIGDQAALAS